MTIEKTYSGYAYIAKKVSHLRRLGLITGKNSGIGKNGGAAPDWLITEQKQTKGK